MKLLQYGKSNSLKLRLLEKALQDYERASGARAELILIQPSIADGILGGRGWFKGVEVKRTPHINKDWIII